MIALASIILKNISAKDIDILTKEAYNKGIGRERIREKPKGELIVNNNIAKLCRKRKEKMYF